jgi:hypothetical protein
MTKFLVERSFSVGEDQMLEIGRRSRARAGDPIAVFTWHHSPLLGDQEGNGNRYWD